MTGWLTPLPVGATAPAEVFAFFCITIAAVRLVRTVLRWMGLT